MAVLGAYPIQVVDLLPCRVELKTTPNFVYAEIPRYSILPASIELEVELFKKQQTVRFAAYDEAIHDPLASISIKHHSSDKTQTRTVTGSLSITNELEVSIRLVHPKKETSQTIACPSLGKLS
ncbi:hypothetical protein DSO57_1035859 [Entomophthora muscae]|uniref:Uncharacterized protein n=1 Tax=Entomophthora muscae TaxID=34485 RepID=A0ACC2RQB7_9FUNG|nr:hypothetical protein DSO57_1035859 [Entomophthora muscae]